MTAQIPTREQILELLNNHEDGEYLAALNYWDETLSSALVDLVDHAQGQHLFGDNVDVSFWPMDDSDSTGGLVTVDVGPRSDGVRYASRYHELRHILDTELTGYELLVDAVITIGSIVKSTMPAGPELPMLDRHDVPERINGLPVIGVVPLPHDSSMELPLAVVICRDDQDITKWVVWYWMREKTNPRGGYAGEGGYWTNYAKALQDVAKRCARYADYTAGENF